MSLSDTIKEVAFAANASFEAGLREGDKNGESARKLRQLLGTLDTIQRYITPQASIRVIHSMLRDAIAEARK